MKIHCYFQRISARFVPTGWTAWTEWTEWTDIGNRRVDIKSCRVPPSSRMVCERENNKNHKRCCRKIPKLLKIVLLHSGIAQR